MIYRVDPPSTPTPMKLADKDKRSWSAIEAESMVKLNVLAIGKAQDVFDGSARQFFRLHL
jgi:hypothetical protein